MKTKTNRGFTLIELLVVIAIIGILSSVVLASLSGSRTKAAQAAFKAEVSSLVTKLNEICIGKNITMTDFKNTSTFTADATHINLTAPNVVACYSNSSSHFSITITPTAGKAGSCTSATVDETKATFYGTGC